MLPLNCCTELYTAGRIRSLFVFVGDQAVLQIVVKGSDPAETQRFRRYLIRGAGNACRSVLASLPQNVWGEYFNHVCWCRSGSSILQTRPVYSRSSPQAW